VGESIIRIFSFILILYLFLPKFRLEYGKELKDQLVAMGMCIAFSGSADFSGIADCALMISSVLHKTFIEVNEEGAEAAAATSIEIVGTAPNDPKPRNIVMRIDHPFIFAIREKTSGTILFIGKVVNPNQ